MGREILLDSWVKVSGSCEITCDLVGDEAQFRFVGDGSSELELIMTEAALEKFVPICADALRGMHGEQQAEQSGESAQ
ncbi:hypothetical protein [Goodfellowiella coeruleoviolacea]|uniref:Uncharacterized protein n=1 Tax=Goodfellowiella coeruleoviolacea TaxID=334858 RepID=A0AAE3GID1_9PSEU|nr:hypothetical protein [Goodfellowiella coeruleoviolacea]MCP2168015.1 hypothetical protein [Goodfellowiella coeruleoviolacea]